MNTKNLILLLILFIASLTFSFSQSVPKHLKKIRKEQYEVSYENYQNTWNKKELKSAKEIRKIQKRQAKEQRKADRFFAKIARIKGTKVVARKEASDV